jgi:PLP dependent protein
MSDAAARIAENLANIRQRIAQAAARSGRPAEAVRLVAVTKFAGLDEIRSLLAAGGTELGESRPQQLWERAEALRHMPIRWHLIGHLQRNKVRRTLPLVGMIQSVDSVRLLETIDEAAAGPVPVLIEVNVSAEAAKHGFTPDEAERLAPRLADFRSVEVRGLMCMAALEGGPDVARRDFAALRELRDRLRANCPPGVALDELSMGMSGDFELAIEEGATIVRVGSALFE